MLSRIKVLVCLISFLFACQSSSLAVVLKDQSPPSSPQIQKPLIDKGCGQLNEADGIIIKFKAITKQNFRTANFKLSTTQTLTGPSSYSIDPSKLKPLISDDLEKSLTSTKSLTANLAASSKFQKKKDLLKAAIAKHGLDRVFSYRPGTSLQSNLKTSLKQQQVIGIKNQCYELKHILNELKKDPAIEYAEPNLKVKAQAVDKTKANDYFFNHQGSWGQAYDDLWGLKKIQADKAWAYSEGEGVGVVVAVIDTGVDYNHPDLWDNIWVNPEVVSDCNLDGKINLDDLDLNSNKNIEPEEIIEDSIGYDFSYGDNDPFDGYGHGSHVAGTIAAVKNNNIGVVGVAPKAKILAIKGLDDEEGSGSYEQLAQAVLYAAEYADISNNSWGGYGQSQVLEEAFQIASELGMISFVAAGNSTDDAKYYIPASFPTVITVSSSALNDEKSYFSNYGEVVDIAAPGGGINAIDFDPNNILSTISASSNIGGSIDLKVEDPSTGNKKPYAYYRIAGTSMACPHAAGVGALIKSLHPEYNFNDVLNIITQTSDKTLVGDIYYGAGRLNALNSVTAAYPPPYLELTNLYDPDSNFIIGPIDFNISITKSNAGKEIIEKKLEFSFDKINWTELPINFEDGINYSYFDSYGFNDGKVFFKLSVKDIEGKEFFLDKTFIIDNYNITNPLPADTLNQYDPISIRVNPTGLEKSYTVEYGIGLEPTKWLNSGITKKFLAINNLIQVAQPIPIPPQYQESIEIAELDPNFIPIKDEIITIKIKTSFDNGRIKEDKVPFFLDSQLKKGFPVYSYKFPDDPQNEHYFANNFPHTTIVNLDKDNEKEIIVVTQQKNILTGLNEELIIAIDHTGKVLWKSPGYERINQLVIADRDNNGQDEIFAIANSNNLSNELFVLDSTGKIIKSIMKFDSDLLYYSLMAADYNHDGQTELILIKDQDDDILKKEVCIINSNDYTIRRIQNLPNDYKNNEDRYLIRNTNMAKLGNFDSDPDLELAYFLVFLPKNSLEALHVINLNDGSTLNNWIGLGEKAFKNNTILYPEGFLVSDLNNDGLDEIISGGGYIDEYVVYWDFNRTIIFDSGEISSAYWDSGRHLSHQQRLALPISKTNTQKGILGLYYDYFNHTIKSNIKFTKSMNEDTVFNSKFSGDIDTLYFSIDRLQQTVMDIDLDGELEIFDNYGNARYNIPNQSSWTGGVFAYKLDGSIIDLNSNPNFNTLLLPPEEKKLTAYDLEAYYSTKFAVPILADLDSNNKLDLVINQRTQAHYLSHLGKLKDSYRSAIYAWELPYTYNKTKDSVTEYLGNGQRTGGKTGIRPRAGFSISTQEADTNTPVTLNASISTGDSIVSYSWDFNSDGIFEENSTIPILSRKFNQGLYKVTLKITDALGFTSTATQYLNIFPAQPLLDGSIFIDDGMDNFSLNGTWTYNSRFTTKDAVGSDFTFTNKKLTNQETKKASWNFTNLYPGIYKVFTTWSSGINRATNAPYTIFNGTSSITSLVNQEQAPFGANYLNRPWKSLANNFSTRTDSIKVELSNEADDFVFADAVLLSKVFLFPKADFTISSQDANSSENITLNASSSIGDGVVNYSWDFNSDGVFDKTSLLPILIKKFNPGLYNITLKITNIFGESSLASKYLNVFPIPSAESTVKFIDDGMEGFTTTGNWSNSERFVAKDTIGYDMKFANKRLQGENLQKAIWSFTELKPGVYDIYTTWSQGTVSSRTTNAPYTFFSESTKTSTVTVNQKLAPSGITYLNRPWQKLGTVTVIKNSITVILSNNANDYVFADAVLVKKIQ